MYYQNNLEQSITGFPQGSVIGPSLANFTLNGLESVIIPSQKTAFDEENYSLLAAEDKIYEPGNSKVRKTLRSSVIRFADDFIIICNGEKQAELLQNKIKIFLAHRGLKINDDKSCCIK